MVSGYADAVVVRHPREGAAKLATEFSDVPIINAGDGAHAHPTQGLLDAFTFKEVFPETDGRKVRSVADEIVAHLG